MCHLGSRPWELRRLHGVSLDVPILKLSLLRPCHEFKSRGEACSVYGSKIDPYVQNFKTRTGTRTIFAPQTKEPTLTDCREENQRAFPSSSTLVRTVVWVTTCHAYTSATKRRTPSSPYNLLLRRRKKKKSYIIETRFSHKRALRLRKKIASVIAKSMSFFSSSSSKSRSQVRKCLCIR